MKYFIAAFIMVDLLANVHAQCSAFAASNLDSNYTSNLRQAFSEATDKVESTVAPDPCDPLLIVAAANSYAEAIAPAIATSFSKTVALVDSFPGCKDAGAITRGEASGKAISKAIAEAYAFAVAFTFGFQHFAFARSQAVAQSVETVIAQAVSKSTVENNGFAYSEVGSEAEAAASVVANAIAQFIIYIYGCP